MQCILDRPPEKQKIRQTKKGKINQRMTSSLIPSRIKVQIKTVIYTLILGLKT